MPIGLIDINIIRKSRFYNLLKQMRIRRERIWKKLQTEYYEVYEKVNIIEHLEEIEKQEIKKYDNKNIYNYYK